MSGRAPGGPVIIEAAINGGRGRQEHPRVPVTPAGVAAAARACAATGASVVHVHAQDAGGGWSADPAHYAAMLRAIREAAPGLLISITSLRPADVSAPLVLDLLAALARDPATRPDLLSVNLGHIVAWESAPAVAPGGPRRRTRHFPNDYADIAAVLARCRDLGIVPELGVMDLGFISNAVALRDDGLLPEPAWFLLELDSPAWGAGRQVAPATTENYDLCAAILRREFPRAAWAAHGVGRAGYAVLRRALVSGAHLRVGFEDAIELPDGRPADSNADLVAWAAAEARAHGRAPATVAEARAIIAGRAG